MRPSAGPRYRFVADLIIVAFVAGVLWWTGAPAWAIVGFSVVTWFSLGPLP